MKIDRKWIFVITGVLLVCVCAAATLTAGGGLGYLLFNRAKVETGSGLQKTRVIRVEESAPVQATGTPGVPGLTPGVDLPDGETHPTPTAFPSPAELSDTLAILKSEIVPLNDPIDLARRLSGKENISPTFQGTPPVYEIGVEKLFWISNLDTNENHEIMATLRYRTDHLYFWIENGVRYSEQNLAELCETFENKIYPTNREYFGSEWTPGVDNDPHLYVLFAGGLGNSVGGYFSSADAYPEEARKFSNAHEMFLINADLVSLAGESILGTMAHEFQHMIHWYQDRNEETWISEGFSTLAQLLNGYPTGSFDSIYAGDPDLQLNTWPESDNSFPYYGASFLFASYFLDRFGEEGMKAVVSQPQNGLEGIDTVLEEMRATDPGSGEPIRADDVFSDWVITSFLNDPDAGDGRYVYRRYPSAAQPRRTEEINHCASEWLDREVMQYGADYIKINCPGSYVLKFEGTAQVGVVAQNAYSGRYAYWSNKGDESDMTLTRTFDFTQASGPLTLRFHTWYDLEQDYDYLYLVVSEDGENWKILQTPSGIDTDPSGNSYGWGYTGQTGEWIEENVDLSRFAGKKVQIRFEYITDLAVNKDGFLLDDVSIPEIQYMEDFEAGEGGWEGSGFVRIDNVLPQTFRLSIIRFGRQTSVETVKLEAGQTASIPLELGNEVQNAVLVVSGTTRFTTQSGQYRFQLVK